MRLSRIKETEIIVFFCIGETIAQALHEKFPKSALVLTMGEKGTLYLDSNKIVLHPVY